MYQRSCDQSPGAALCRQLGIGDIILPLLRVAVDAGGGWPSERRFRCWRFHCPFDRTVDVRGVGYGPSREHSDYFAKNMAAIVTEAPCANGPYRPSAFVSGTFPAVAPGRFAEVGKVKAARLLSLASCRNSVMATTPTGMSLSHAFRQQGRIRP